MSKLSNTLFHNMEFEFFLPPSLNFFVKGCNVLDIAGCLAGSSICLSERGAKSVIGTDPRPETVDQAIEYLKKTNITNVNFKQGDVTDFNDLKIMLTNIDTVTTFGMLYHLTDHNMIFKTIAESQQCKYLLFETEYGPETDVPDIGWYIESTQSIGAGFNNYPTILAGAPNLEWFKQTLDIYGWQIVYYKSFLSQWELQPPSLFVGPRQRIIVGAVNKKFVDTSHLPKLPDDMWIWHIEPNQVVGKHFNAYEA